MRKYIITLKEEDGGKQTNFEVSRNYNKNKFLKIILDCKKASLSETLEICEITNNKTNTNNNKKMLRCTIIIRIDIRYR